ncbi:serine/threonine-protein kinase [Sorangium sp. So ce590]|uniref:serine/threonine protein kinase n=1 Tax=Sorangium sp. So ce590 TaxID=3133317 RepID=UPI003F5E3A84
MTIDLTANEPVIATPTSSNSQLRSHLTSFGLELEREAVGTGGSATVHKCIVKVPDGRLPAAGTPVAVKQYKRELFTHEGQLRRVQQEADLGAALNSPNIVKTFGLLPSANDPEFLVMEWIDGPTLEGWNKSIEAEDVSWDRLRAIALGLVNGLQHLHAKGVYHRDLKPENVMLRADETPVIMDVGVAELTVESAETLHTNVGQFLGSMRYASPQYLMGEKFGAPDDIYGLGTILFELFTGKRMFDGLERKTALPVLIAQEGQRVESLRDSVPAPLKVLLQACIHRDRARRPQVNDLKVAMEDPAGSRFITTELERQTAEERAFPVLKTLDNGMSFYADLGGSDSYLGMEFTVVRRGEPITVPSLSRRIVPEQWVGAATLKHIFQNVGHFVLMGKRWEEGRGGLASLAGIVGSGGHWVEYEQLATSVKAGDWVLKERR